MKDRKQIKLFAEKLSLETIFEVWFDFDADTLGYKEWTEGRIDDNNWRDSTAQQDGVQQRQTQK